LEENHNKKFVLITGASKGIGRAISIELARQGYSLIIIARDKKKLLELKELLTKEHEVEVLAISADLSKRETSKSIVDGIKKKGMRVFGLVNNAGFGQYGYFDEKSAKDYAEIIETNIVSLTMLTFELMEDIKKTEGFIMNVSCITGIVPTAYMTVHGATKSYVTSFTEALAQEYPSLRIYAIHPWFADTDFIAKSGLKEWSENKSLENPEEIAIRAVAALDSNETIVFTSGKQRRSHWLSRFMPRKNAASGMEKMLRPETKKE
jgi:uncharacterized protein